MPYRKTIFANNHYYHILNRGVNKGVIFQNSKEYQRFIDLVDFYRLNPDIRFSHYGLLSDSGKQEYIDRLRQNNKVLVEIISFCLMPNHFHLLLKQVQDGGLQNFIRCVQNGYAKFFNTRNKRSGPLFQSAFKSVLIESNEQLLHVSRYIHLNPATSNLIKIEHLSNYGWSSFKNFLGDGSYEFINPGIVTDQFEDKSDYKDFVNSQADYQRELDQIKSIVLD